MRVRIYPVTDPAQYDLVTPNFIYNRYDLFQPPVPFHAVCIRSDSGTKCIEYRITDRTAEIALWLTPITELELDMLLLYISKNHPQVKTVTYQNGVLSRGNAKAHNHFRIPFPDTVEEMEHSISSKSRAKMRKKVLHAQEAYGPLTLKEYDRDSMPDEVVEAFFRFKAIIRKRSYNMTPQEYLDRYHVSHCYVAYFGDTIGAIRFSCEQCPVVYGENFTYNPDMSEYSLGRFIFMHHLKRMVEKKHTQLFFAGGNYEYKTHFGSIEETLYDCKIDLPQAISQIRERRFFSKRAQRWIKTHLPAPIVRVLRKGKKCLKSLKKHLKK